MDPALVGVLSALGGALIGASASVATIFVQSHFQGKRELRRMAVDAAIEDHKQAVELARHIGHGAIAPLTAFMHYHVAYLDLLMAGKVTAKNLEKLRADFIVLFKRPPPNDAD